MSYTIDMAHVLKRLAEESGTVDQVAARAFPRAPQSEARRRAGTALLALQQQGDVFQDPDGTVRLCPGSAAQVAAGARRNLADMRPAAERLLETLRGHAERIEIAGSIRRGKDTVKDIEIVALARTEADMFGAPTGAPPAIVRDLRERAVHVVRGGAKYTQAIVADPDAGPVAVDLFVTTDPAQWGMLYFIRTGCGDFARRALAHWKTITGGGYCQENRLHRPDGTQVPTPEEEDVFAALGCPFVPPERRAPRP